MSSRKRRIRVKSPTPPESSPHAKPPQTEGTPFTQQRIMFSIECCSTKCCYKKIRDKRDRCDFADRLHELSQLTWGDVRQTSRKGLGYETLDNINIDRSMFPQDARTIGFAYHDNHRMWGYKDREGIFHITGFDYDGKRYKH